MVAELGVLLSPPWRVFDGLVGGLLGGRWSARNLLDCRCFAFLLIGGWCLNMVGGPWLVSGFELRQMVTPRGNSQ